MKLLRTELRKYCDSTKEMLSLFCFVLFCFVFFCFVFLFYFFLVGGGGGKRAKKTFYLDKEDLIRQ